MRLIVLLGLASAAIGPAAANAPPPVPELYRSAATSAMNGDYDIAAEGQAACTIGLYLFRDGDGLQATVPGDNTDCYARIRQLEGATGKLTALSWQIGPLGELILIEEIDNNPGGFKAVFTPDQETGDLYAATFNGATITLKRRGN